MALDRKDSSEPLIRPDPVMKSYYDSLESRIGYLLVLGDTRHFGYYEKDTYWPFPTGAALRRMEDKLYRRLNLPEGSRVLDAGCGVGHVALYMARQGLRVTAIDIMDRHIIKARRNVARARLPPGQVEVRWMDYHHLETIADESHDGVYTIETFVHASDPVKVLAGFHRIIRPGGRLTMHEYDHTDLDDARVPREVADSMRLINKYSAMPSNTHSNVLVRLVEEAGFTDVKVDDYSQNIRPMLRWFYVLAIIPYFIMKLLGLERYIPNTVAGARAYTNQEHWRYLAISATKPGPKIEAAKTK